ncbi:MAG TPA: ATP-binding cassette domain-containing protein [Planctomycetota bacterium]|nr:ATP-binding cassette domain-containing protein [Planctomycetota bacterium]
MSDAAEVVLALDGLTVVRGGRAVLDGVDVSVRRGEIVVVAGPSGAGKSTLLRALLGLPPAGAVVRWTRYALRDAAGREVLLRRPEDLARRGLRGRTLGFLAQDPAASLDPLRAVGDEADEAVTLASVADDAAARRERVLDAFVAAGWDAATASLRARPFQLSGGQAQRAALATTRAAGPAVLLLDEPTSALNAEVAASMLRRLRREADRGERSAVLVTHDPRAAAAVADRVLVLDGGRAVEEATVQDLFAAPRTAAGRAFAFGAPPPERRAPGDAAIVEAAQASFEYRGYGALGFGRRPVPALRDASVAARRGGTLALLGASGAGKSTLGLLLAGLLTPTRGAVLFEGGPLGRLSFRERTRRLRWAPQDAFGTLDPRHTAREHLRHALHDLGTRDGAETARRLAEACEAAAFEAATLDRRPHELSGGERRRVLLARALLSDPDVLILDEAPEGLDAPLRRRVLEAARGPVDRGRTTVLVSHDVAFARAAADHAAVLDAGRVVAAGPTDAVLDADAGPPAARRLAVAALPARPSERAAWLAAED